MQTLEVAASSRNPYTDSRVLTLLKHLLSLKNVGRILLPSEKNAKIVNDLATTTT